VERLNHSCGWTVSTVYVGDGYVGGAPESTLVRRWWVSGEMGLGGEESLPCTSGLGAFRKPPKFKPKRCVLDPTWTARLMWHLPKRYVLWQLMTVRKKIMVGILL
jgi:hypothetical protein